MDWPLLLRLNRPGLSNSSLAVVSVMTSVPVAVGSKTFEVPATLEAEAATINE